MWYVVGIVAKTRYKKCLATCYGTGNNIVLLVPGSIHYYNFL